MAKELPYFKFFVSEWNDGDITLEDLKTQGLYINICSYYWSNDCEVTLEKLQKKFKTNRKQIENLVKAKIIKLDSEKNVLINFLIEQNIERENLSKQNSVNALKRWKEKREESERIATALDSDCESDAIKKREEEIRKEENKIIKVKVYSIEIHNCFNNCLNYFDKHLHPKNNDSWLDTIDKLNRIDGIPFEKIEEVVKKTRGDDFWKQNFLSLTKLRKKNKEDIMYVVVFNEKIKGNGVTKSRRQKWNDKIAERDNSQ